ncbi:hypothetical protein RIF29_28515 [Crotalaria pallida]|uniref:Uncharacterized protein n=1 Tax=Crotalaria pallida TaxID=3830 RepID=A0AAN9HV39_CROPI
MFNNNLQESASLHKPPSPLPFPHLVSIESIPFPFPPVHHHRHQTPIGSDPPLPTRHQANGDRYQHQANAKLHSTRRRPRKDFGSDPPRSPRHRRSPPKMVFVFIIIKLPPIAKAMQGRVIAPMADLDKGKSVYASRDLPIAGNGSRKRLSTAPAIVLRVVHDAYFHHDSSGSADDLDF